MYVFLSCVGLNHYVAITKFIILLYNRLRISISFITSLNKNERNKIAAVYGKSRLEMECALVVVIVSKLNTEVTVPEKLICYIRCYTRCQPWSSDRFSREKQVVYISERTSSTRRFLEESSERERTIDITHCLFFSHFFSFLLTWMLEYWNTSLSTTMTLEDSNDIPPSSLKPPILKQQPHHLLTSGY